MNKYDRRIMNIGVNKFFSSAIPALSEFSDTIDNLKSNEEDKFDRLPDSLKDSHQADNIEESVELLESLQDDIEAIQKAIDSISSDAEICIPDIINKAASLVSADNDPRTCRFQILLSESTLILLRLRALQEGVSCNELVCRAIQSELTRDPNY